MMEYEQKPLFLSGESIKSGWFNIYIHDECQYAPGAVWKTLEDAIEVSTNYPIQATYRIRVIPKGKTK